MVVSAREPVKNPAPLIAFLAGPHRGLGSCSAMFVEALESKQEPLEPLDTSISTKINAWVTRESARGRERARERGRPRGPLSAPSSYGTASIFVVSLLALAAAKNDNNECAPGGQRDKREAAGRAKRGERERRARELTRFFGTGRGASVRGWRCPLLGACVCARGRPSSQTTTTSACRRADASNGPLRFLPRRASNVDVSVRTWEPGVKLRPPHCARSRSDSSAP